MRQRRRGGHSAVRSKGALAEPASDVAAAPLAHVPETYRISHPADNLSRRTPGMVDQAMAFTSAHDLAILHEEYLVVRGADHSRVARAVRVEIRPKLAPLIRTDHDIVHAV